jgi:O-antigen/teichoic acid export membrane protein
MIGRLKKKWSQYQRHELNQELLLNSLFALLVRVAGAGATFLMSIIISRHLGAEQSGYVFLGITVATLVANLGRIGADLSILKYVSVYSSNQQWKEVSKVMKILLKWSYFPLLLITAFMAFFAEQLAVYLFKKPEFQWTLFWSVLSIPFFAGYNIYSMALQAIRKVVLSISGLRLLTPVLLILMVIFMNPNSSYETSIYYLISTLLNFVICFIWWKHHTPTIPVETDTGINVSQLWSSSKEFWIVAAGQQLVLWSGQIIAGVYVDDPAVLAQLAVARNTASLISFTLQAVNNVSAPRFASLYAAGKMDELKSYAINSTRLMTIASLPFIAALCLFPTKVLSLFGAGFSEGKYFLMIIAFGQFVNVATGSVAYLLSMTGNEKPLRQLRLVSAFIAVILSLILTPAFGGLGSAIATSLALIFSNMMAVFLVKKYLGFSTLNMIGLK